MPKTIPVLIILINLLLVLTNSDKYDFNSGLFGECTANKEDGKCTKETIDKHTMEDVNLANGKMKTKEQKLKDMEVVFDTPKIINIDKDPEYYKQFFDGSKDEKHADDCQCKAKQEDFFEHLKAENHRNLQDQSCAQAKMYVGIFHQTAGSLDSLTPQDIRIRESNKHQYFTGILDLRYELTRRDSCFLLIVDEYGAYVNSLVVYYYQNQDQWNECYALDLTADNRVVAVGMNFNQVAAQQPAGRVDRTSALIVSTDLDLGDEILKLWSYSMIGEATAYDQIAWDVASSSDGSIYVTGYHTGWVHDTEYDCFVLRLDHLLETVYAKSFGSALSERCTQIQVSRNFDRIYLGGDQTYITGPDHYRMIFFQLDMYADNILTNKYIYTDNLGHDLTLKRMMITNPRDLLTGGAADQLIYFCASYLDDTELDVIYGQMDANFNLNFAYKYGAPNQNDEIGDCTITSDGRYMFLTFSSNYYVARTAADIVAQHIFPLADSQYNVPFNTYDSTRWNTCDEPGCVFCAYFGCPTCPGQCRCNCGGDTMPDCERMVNGASQNIWNDAACFECHQNGYYSYWQIVDNQHNNIVQYCRDEFSASLQPYLDDYNANVFTWHTCHHYSFDMGNMDCDVSGLFFPYCNTVTDLSCGNHACNTAAYQAELNLYKPWYTYFASIHTDFQGLDTYGNALDGNEYFQGDIWYRYLCNQPYHTWMPYMFCDTGPNHYYDDYIMIFEQDCSDGYVQYQDFFIIKVELTTMSTAAAYIDYQPENAVYYGMYDGDEVPFTIAVDEYGFVYVAGTSNSPEYGVLNGNTNWGMLFVKTHWDLNIEMNVGKANVGVAPEWTVGTYLKTRFVTPKKYRNREPVTGNSYGITFMENFLPYVSTNVFPTHIDLIPDTQSIYYEYKPKSINERTSNNAEYNNADHWTLSTFAALDIDTVNTIYAVSMMQMSQPYVMHLNKDRYYSFQLNTGCFDIPYSNREFTYTIGTLGGLAIVNKTGTTSAPYIQGTVTSEKGIYYFDDFMTRSYSPLQYCNNPIAGFVYCPEDNYGDWWDMYKKESLSRFMFGFRFMIVVDDLTTANRHPQVLQNIPDQTPIAGHWTEFTIDVATYFTPSDQCVYFMARQGVNPNSGYTITETTQLPYWIQYYETNSTFLVYPPNTEPTICVQLYCCDEIDQCAVNTFYVTPYTTQPTLTTDVSQAIYVLHYDNLEGYGEHFTWGRSSDNFADADEETASPIDVYDHMDHAVLLTYTGAINGFNSIDLVGLIYGQVFAPNVFTTTLQPQQVPFEYYDLYMYTIVPQVALTSYLQIVMNRMPQSTVAGRTFTFDTLDPYDYIGDASGKYGLIFPWLRQSPENLYYLDVSYWFRDDDGDELTYQFTYSDGTQLPSYLTFNQLSGEITIDAYRNFPSEYMNLKITAFDTKNGYFSYFKTLLINTEPEVLIPYHLIEVSVDKDFAYYFGDHVVDYNGDKLRFEMLDAGDRGSLTFYNMEFHNLTHIIRGKALIPMRLVNLKITVTDPYGASVFFYISIQAVSRKPELRNHVKYLPEDQVLYVGHQFYFTFPKWTFYDQYETKPLQIYATLQDRSPLPSWLNFNPYSYAFFGTPPEETTFTVLMTVMDQVSQDLTSVTFKVTVIPTEYPKTNVRYLNNDYTLQLGEWLQATTVINLFEDPESSSFLPLEARGSAGTTFPDWLQWNKFNRTLYGLANETGTTRIDIIYTDDSGRQTFSNLKIDVVEVTEIDPLIIAYAFIGVGGFALVLYFFYSWQFSFNLLPQNLQERKVNKQMAIQAQQRFGKYKEIDLQYYLPRNFGNLKVQKAVITRDFDFKGLGNQYSGRQKFVEQMQISARRYSNNGQFKSRFE